MIQTDVGELPRPTIYVNYYPSKAERDTVALSTIWRAVGCKNKYVRRVKRGLRNHDSHIHKYVQLMGFPIQLWQDRGHDFREVCS
jgi:hypothetical protein